MTTYKLLKDYLTNDGIKIHIIPAGSIIAYDNWVPDTGYMARFDLPPIPKLVVENNPDYFQEAKERKPEDKKPRELLVSIEDNNIIGCGWNDGRPLRVTYQSNLAIFREVIK